MKLFVLSLAVMLAVVVLGGATDAHASDAQQADLEQVAHLVDVTPATLDSIGSLGVTETPAHTLISAPGLITEQHARIDMSPRLEPLNPARLVFQDTPQALDVVVERVHQTPLLLLDRARHNLKDADPGPRLRVSFSEARVLA